MIIKLNMDNDFDRVRNKFILKFIGKMGFDETFIRWMALCISTPWITPLVNGRVVDLSN